MQRPVWMSPSDPRDGMTYRLAHAVDGSLALIGVENSSADEPTVFDAADLAVSGAAGTKFLTVVVSADPGNLIATGSDGLPYPSAETVGSTFPWMRPDDPRALLSHLNNIITERRATETVAATEPTVLPPAIVSVNGVAPDANGVVVLTVPSTDAAAVTVVAADGTGIGAMASAPTPPSA